MDLLNENRSLVHAGKLLRQPETGFEWNGWTELFVLLFDNYSKPYHNPLILFSYLQVARSGADEDEGERWRDKVLRQSQG